MYFTSLVTLFRETKLYKVSFPGFFWKRWESGLNVVFDFSRFINATNPENSLCLPLKINPLNLEILNQAEYIT